MDVQLHINELVLDGFSQIDRYRIAAAVEAEFARLLANQGVPSGLEKGGMMDRLDAGSFGLASDAGPERIGMQVAQGIFGGMAR